MGRKRNRRKSRGRGRNGMSASLFGGIALLIMLYVFIDEFVNAYFGFIFAIIVFVAMGSALVWAGYYVYTQISRIQNYDVSFKYIHRIEHMLKMSSYDFEKYVAFLFKNSGFITEVTPPNGDEGIDIKMKKDGKHYFVQVKQYNKNNIVGSQAVRDFYGSFTDSADEGYFVTTSDFTPAAYEWAKARTKPLHLVSGAKLVAFEETVGEKPEFTFGGVLEARQGAE